MQTKSTTLSRRSIFKRALPLLAAPLAMALPKMAEAAPVSHFELTQKTGLWLKAPSVRGWVIPWPAVNDDAPPPDGWVSTDRTEVTLKTPGLWRMDWRVTFEPGAGNVRSTSAEYWDGEITPGGPDGFHDLADGSAARAVPGNQETTSIGWAYVQSDGKTRVRLKAGHDAGKPINISDRNYESCLSLTLTS